MQQHAIVSAAAIPPAQLHAAFTQAFADYLIGPFKLSLEQWPAFLARQAVDLAQSRAATAAGEAIAFAFVAQRPVLGRWRLATMGALPAARGTGMAARLLDDFITRAARAGMACVELECFAQNERALRLYRSRGFEVVHELFGYVGTPAARAGAEAGTSRHEVSGDLTREVIREVTRDDAMDWLDAAARNIDALPLQVTGESLRSSPAALRAWQCGGALLVSSQNEAGVAVHSLVDAGAGQRDAAALVARLRADNPQATITVPQLQRPDLGGEALERLGFSKMPLHQVLMQRPC